MHISHIRETEKNLIIMSAVLFCIKSVHLSGKSKLTCLFYSSLSTFKTEICYVNYYVNRDTDGYFTVFAINLEETVCISRINFTYRYIDDVLSINNPMRENYLGEMYPFELDNKDTTVGNTSTSYLDLLLSIWRDG